MRWRGRDERKEKQRVRLDRRQYEMRKEDFKWGHMRFTLVRT